MIRRIDLAYFLFLAATLLWPATLGWQMGSLTWGPSRAVYLVLIMTFLVFYSRRRLPAWNTPLDAALLLFIGAGFISLAANSISLTDDQFYDGTKALGLICTEWLILFYMAASIPRDLSDIRRLLSVLSFLILVVAVAGIAEHLFAFRIYEWARLFIPGGESMRSNLHQQSLQAGSASMVRGGITRIVSTTVSFQEVGTLMAMAMPLLMYLIAFTRSQAWRLLHFTTLCFAAAALFLSVTRGAFIAAFIAIAAQSIFSRGSMFPQAAVLAMAPVAVALIMLPNMPAVIWNAAHPDILFSPEETVHDRLEDWPEAQRLLSGHELFGIGPGRVLGKKLRYGSEVSKKFIHTDNYYLAAAVETGAAGAGALLLLWIAIAALLLKRRGWSGSGDLATGGHAIGDLRVALFSSALAFMVVCLTYDALGFPTISKVFWVITGTGMAAVRVENQTERMPLSYG